MTNHNTTYVDARGNPFNLAILSFPIPNQTDLKYINLYLVTAGPTYTLLKTEQVYGTFGYVEYYLPFISAVHGESYAVSWTSTSGVETAKVAATPYFPPLATPESPHMNMGMIGVEQVRRAFLVVRQTGERAVLMQRKLSGDRCYCWNDSTRESLRDCPDCYGVGFLGGYNVFPRWLCRIHPAGTQIQLGDGGFTVNTTNRSWSPIVPLVTDGDAIVRLLPQGGLRCWEINGVTREQREGPGAIPIIQEFNVRLFEIDMPIYRAAEDLIISAVLPVETETPRGMPEDG